MSPPEPTTDEPSVETIMEWADAGGSRATDGCWLEQDDTECEHGHPSWCVALGFVPDARGE
jgi:hypothetical protein